MFAAIARERRTKVRKGEGLGLEFEHCRDMASLREYNVIRSATRTRAGFDAVPWSHFNDTHDALDGTGVYNIFLARHEGRVGAGQIAFVWNGYVFLSGVSVAQWAIDERIPANDFLQWNVLSWAVETGQSFVDFVGAHPGSSDPKLLAIDAFKARWGTELVESAVLTRKGDRVRSRLLRVTTAAPRARATASNPG
jgi:hypothetical protein